jgi:hypothetical protein
MCVATAVLLLTLVASASAKYSGGTGSPNDPYQIVTASDLMLLGNSPDDYGKHFIVTADIDLAPTLPGRKVFDKAVIAPHAGPFGWPFSGPPFAGVFDGGDHTISNLTITGTRCAGLLGQLASGAEVKNVRLVGANVVGSDGYTGGLVGLVGSAGAAVTNCSCEGIIRGHSYIGGLVGYGGARITRCSSSGTVEGSKWSIGGLVGYSCGYIQQCYSTATVSGASWVGGLVGENANTVTECYSTGPVRGNSSVGGLVGYDYPYSQANQCFWDTQTSSRTWSAGGTGKTTAQMQMDSTFLSAGWDFVGETANGTEDIWWIDEGADYPHLSWEMPPPIVPSFGDGADPNLVGWWRFNEGYGTTAFDSSGNGHDGTFMGKPRPVTGKFGQALEFAGQDYVRVTGYTPVSGAGDRTVTAWIKTQSPGPNGIVSWGLIERQKKWVIRQQDWCLRLEIEGANIRGSTSLADGQWHHIAVSFANDGTPELGDAVFYVDGVRDSHPAATLEIETSPTGDFEIGRNLKNDGFFQGSIDDVRIYDRALRGAEIRALMADPGVVAEAMGPDPSNGAVIYNNWHTLRWTPGDLAVLHQVYIGESFNDVNEGKIAPISTWTPVLLVGGAEPFPNGLTPGATYYWRVDEVNEADPCSPWKGRVWSFSVDAGATSIEVRQAEGFETMGLNKLEWPSYGDQKWAVTSGQSHSGTYCARAGSVGDSESSVLEVSLNCISGQISFYYKVSSESGYDYLRFYINDQEQAKWSGEEDWTEVSFPVTEGQRTFRWKYSKDSSGSNGDDTAWIDDIVFPIN